VSLSLVTEEEVVKTRINAARMLFVVAAGISCAASIFLWFKGHREEGVFVGLWVPSILSLGALLLAGRRRVVQ